MEVVKPEDLLNYTVPVSGTVIEIRRAEVSGNTVLYLYLTPEEEELSSVSVYRLSVVDDESIILINAGDEVSLMAAEEDISKEIIRAVKE